MVEDFLARAADPTRDLLLNRYAMIAGLLMILQFHLMPIFAYLFEEDALSDARKDRTGFVAALLDSVAPVARKAIKAAFGVNRSSNFARCLGRNIIILNIYVSQALESAERSLLHSYTHQPFIESVIFAFFESVIMHRLSRWLQKTYFHNYSIQDDDWWKKDKVIDSKFSDFSVPWSMATMTFVAQIGLFFIFVLDMNGDAKTHERCNMNVFHWLIAVLVTNVAGLGESGEGFHKAVWDKMWERPPAIQGAEKVRLHSVQFWTRFFYAGTINGFCRELLLCLAPVALSVADRDELIKDCLAIFFISKMDDIEPKRVGKALKDWGQALKDWGVEPEPADGREEHGLEDGLLQEDPLNDELEDRILRLEERLKRLDGDGDSSTAVGTSRRCSTKS
jgi:hypothetical protein